MVIVGAGQCGARTALTLRESGWQGPITLIGDEPYAPYQRPPLSKAVLLGDTGPESCTITERPALAEIGIDFISGTRAELIDRTTKTVALADGRRISYHKLLLATGARARRIKVPGSELSGIYYLRTMENATALREMLKPGARLAVIGGGFIGLEVAASAITRGCSVTVIELGQRLLMRAVPAEIASLVAERHRNTSVDIRCRAKISGFEGTQRVESIRLDSGSSIPCDMALIGIGAEPEISLACKAGLSIENGIWVDAKLLTSDPDIFAAGDCCSFPHALYGNRRIRLEAWRNAESQGMHAARNMLGADKPYSEVPWFWSDQYEATLQIAGLPAEGRETISRDNDNGPSAHLFFHLGEEGYLVGASAFGTLGAIAKDMRIAQMLIERELQPDPQALASTGVRLKSLLK